MRLNSALFLCGLVLVVLVHADRTCAQDPGAQQPAAAAAQSLTIASYPDSTSGLEHLVKDIMKAQRENQPGAAEALLKSLILPEPRDWYDRVFGGDVSEGAESVYDKSPTGIIASLARAFLEATAGGMTEVRALRYDKSCDDNAGEDAFGILHARLEPVPLYEVRFMKGNTFFRVFAFAYVNGGFRFIFPPKLDGAIFGSTRAKLPAKGNENAPNEPPQESSSRVPVAAKVQSAKLIHQVQPEYPSVAKAEHLQGTVTMHALIGKDGAIHNLYVIKGSCSLANAALAAVQQWRYSPTLLMGQPVEVDTTITVIYQLAR
jgi:TonB family protein